MNQLRQQRRMARIAMTVEELDTFLGGQRTCRVATVADDGRPHVAPLWFLWHDGNLWLNSLIRSQRWADLTRDPRVAVTVDAGEDYSELRGVEISGLAKAVGDVPRTSQRVPQLLEPERLYALKYTGRDSFTPDGRHAWLVVAPDKIVSWDFRKNPGLRMER
jgi:nitroimidazol reductase NimA-like FMN-containing flavoprotein (pyridoxamine 5'-phosphate oxidase superfamily)